MADLLEDLQIALLDLMTAPMLSMDLQVVEVSVGIVGLVVDSLVVEDTVDCSGNMHLD